MIDQVNLALAGYTMRQDTMTSLATAIDADDTTITLISVDNIGQGVIEIEDELVYVTVVNRQASTVTVPAWGRGYNGTVAASHAAGVRVTATPTFPRKAIADAINDTIRAVSSDLFTVGTTTFTFSPAVNTYALPAGTDGILSIAYEQIGPSKEWVKIRKYDMTKAANTTAFPTGVSVTIGQYVEPGRTVNVKYSGDPNVLVNASDVFTTTTGLPASCEDVIRYGAQHRLLTNIEPGRLAMTSPEADYQSTRVTFGSGTNTAKYVYALFQQRLAEESKRLKGKYGSRIHYTR